ncbi:MAG: hypothetical protein ACYTG4_10895 [Planctomycetota bacterium]
MGVVALVLAGALFLFSGLGVLGTLLTIINLLMGSTLLARWARSESDAARP